MLPLCHLDCTPLREPAGVRISDKDLRRIEPLQQVLLSPLDHDSVDDWRRAVNRTLKSVFDSDAAMFQLDFEGLPLQLSEEFASEAVRRYVGQYMPEFESRDIYRRILHLGAGNRFMLWGSELEWFYDSAYFNELVVEMRAFDPLFVSAPVRGARFPAVIHAYHDTRISSRFFDAADVNLLRLARNALEAGVNTVTRVAASRASLAASMETSRDGAMVYDAEGRLLHRNPAVAQLALTAGAEKTLTEVGHQMARTLASRCVVDRLVATETSRVLTRTGELLLRAVRLGAGVFTLGPAVLVTITPAAALLPDRQTLKERFGLTRRQAEVALLLAGRKTDPEIAELLCISPHTARHHSEAVMGKLGLTDRREIAARISAPAPWLAAG